MEISFFSSNSGRCYVEDFIDDLIAPDQAAPKKELEIARKRLKEVLP
jgi:hypothetical protein